MDTGRFHCALIGPAKSELHTDSSFQSNTRINLIKKSQTYLTSRSKIHQSTIYYAGLLGLWDKLGQMNRRPRV